MESKETRRINVTFPTRLLEDLDEIAPHRKRSQIIVAATADYVRKLKLLTAIRETAGIWEDPSHPELATPEDIDRWLHEMRTNWRREPLVQGEGDA